MLGIGAAFPSGDALHQFLFLAEARRLHQSETLRQPVDANGSRSACWGLLMEDGRLRLPKSLPDICMSLQGKEFLSVLPALHVTELRDTLPARKSS